ncbi:MAG TPA: S41 family peptidase [Terracidiphilus sp.]|nr:S41 family peptidase [Terracidiphilus sp.]
MRVCSRLVPWAAVLLVVLSTSWPSSAQHSTSESVQTDRLVTLAKLWAAVKYFHPYLAYRTDIDWDQALVKAIPKVNAARNTAEYAAAIEGMLSELGDPVTRVLNDSKPALVPAPENPAPVERQPTFRKNADGVIVVSMTRYSDFTDFVGTQKKLEAVKKEVPTARAVVFDLRPATPPSDSEQGNASDAITDSGIAGLLTTTPLDMPGERRRMHLGFAPQDGTTSGRYSSGFYLQGRQPIKPAGGGKDIPVVFIIGPHSDLPEMALGLQASGKGAIVSEGSSSEESSVSTQIVDLPDEVKVQLRLGELVYADGTGGIAANIAVPASNKKSEEDPAMQAALQLANAGKFPPPPRSKVVEQAAAPRDKTYDDMPYPPVEYRLLGAFRVWAVINYFYPYKGLMGEDWNDTLRQFIPRMEAARDALDYNLAIAEMVTHIHDSHGVVYSDTLVQHFGDASAPIRVRNIEGLPVITGFTDGEAAKNAGFEIGDVILNLDGQDARQRIAERLKYTAFSTPQAGLFRATERSLARGPKDSIATFTIRDVHDQVREVKVARKVEYMPKSQGDRSGEIMRLLPGNIGYADLDRLRVTQVDEMFEKFKDCPAIIFDDRGYPQGTAWSIAPRLTDKNDVVAALFRRRDPASADFPNGELASSEALTTFLQSLPHTEKSRYHGRTVMLVDERTISQAEHTGLFFEAANGTKFIGSPTQGANGDVTNLSVPGGILVYFTGQGVWHADGRQLQRMGLQPAIEVLPTLTGIRAGKDEVLDKAIEYLQRDPQ